MAANEEDNKDFNEWRLATLDTYKTRYRVWKLAGMPPLADVTNVTHERIDNTNVPHRDPSPVSFIHDPGPHHLANTLKPSEYLRRDKDCFKKTVTTLT